MSDVIVAPEKLAYSVEETLAVLGIGRATLYQLINAGSIRTVKAGGRRLVPKTALHAFLDGGGNEAA